MVKIAINSILGIGLIIIWLKFVDIKQIFETISKADPIYLLPVVFFLTISPVTRALRLKIFLSSSLISELQIKKLSLRELIFLNGSALLLNFLIPIRAGEVAKGIYLTTRYHFSLAKSILWVFLDRFIDFLAVLMLAGVLISIIPTQLPVEFGRTISIIFVSLIILVYLIVYRANLTRKIIKFLRPLLILNSIKIYFDRFTTFIIETFSILNRKPKDIFLIILITIISYLTDAFVWFFIFLSLGHPQEYFRMFLGQLLSALTYLIPAAPGYVGSAEASGLLILSGVFGVEVNLASAMIVLFHIISAIFILIFGIVSIFFLKIDLGVILKRALKRG